MKRNQMGVRGKDGSRMGDRTEIRGGLEKETVRDMSPREVRLS